MFKIFLLKNLPQKVKDFTISTVRSLYNLDLEVLEITYKDIDFSYNNLRKQYNAGKILERFSEKYRDFMVLISDDIYVNHLNFVFGVAYPRVGTVISTYRLQLNADEERFYERLEKTIKHELGHYFGLKHCKNYCVMRFANSLYELDIKARDYCDKCKTYLKSISILRTSL